MCVCFNGHRLASGLVEFTHKSKTIMTLKSSLETRIKFTFRPGLDLRLALNLFTGISVLETHIDFRSTFFATNAWYFDRDLTATNRNVKLCRFFLESHIFKRDMVLPPT